MRLLLLIFFIPLLVFGNGLAEDDDPTIFNNVNVITGNLNVTFHDESVNSAVPIHLTRFYSSSGYLEKDKNNYDLLLNAIHKGWNVSGGWSFLPHKSLLVEEGDKVEKYQAHVYGKSGTYLSFKFDKFEDKKKLIISFKPADMGYFSYGNLSGNTNPKNYQLKIDLKNFIATLSLPDGTQRVYSSFDKNKNSKTFNKSYYYLKSETLPSKHTLQYFYDNNRHLKKIVTTNPSGSKIFSSLTFDVYAHKHSLERLFCKTSTGKFIDYNFKEHENRTYLREVFFSNKPSENNVLIPSRKKAGGRINTFYVNGKEQLFVNYYNSENIKDERKWVENPGKIPLQIDKVKNINRLIDANGKRVCFASFLYYKTHTDVRDVENLLTRFHHDSKKLLEIEYFDQNDKLHSMQKFFWSGNQLKCKAKFDDTGKALFAKSFLYDCLGNVTLEVFWGTLTGNEVSEIEIDGFGDVSGGSSFTKSYSYYPDTNLRKEEKEENGLRYVFTYIPNTNLLNAKLIYDGSEIIAREIYIYDDDHLLIKTFNDDGSSPDINNLSDVTELHCIEYENDPQTGLKTAVSELYWDFDKRHYLKARSKKLKYSSQNQVIEETIYDFNDDYRYTIYIEYDEYGNVTRKTTPIGQEETFVYDHIGNLLESKEVGSEPKKFAYDSSNNLIEILGVDSNDLQLTTYDLKRRPIKVVDPKGNIITNNYDCFGNRTQTVFPSINSHNDDLITPKINCQYDIFGNLVTLIAANDEITKSIYNAYGKSLKTTYPDGSEINHIYDKDGILLKTTLQDETVIVFQYDYLKRPILKEIFSNRGDLLSSESWTYSFFKLISHKNPTGLTTNYKYDGAGRKVEEDIEGIKTTFFYDALGFNIKVQTKDIFNCKSFDDAGRVIKKWEEDIYGNIKNLTTFYYDLENRKTKAERLTSKGIATDWFYYDVKGRIIKHQDPDGNVCSYAYEDGFINELSKKVLKTTTTDQLGNKTIKIENVNGKTDRCIKKDFDDKTVFDEKYYYDISGNLAKRISSKVPQVEDIIVCWKYDCMDRVIEEIEADKKKTRYIYDLKGRLSEKVLPNEILIQYSYDGIDRLIEEKSSNGGLHCQYVYGVNELPIEFHDIKNKTVVYRKYNKFNLLEEELDSNGFKMSWEYDDLNRCVIKTLPDNTSIAFSYEGLYMRSVKRLTPDKMLLYEHVYDEFDPNGHVNLESLINKLGSVKTEYDAFERPVSQSSPWAKQSLTYGKSGLIESKENSLIKSKNYFYDALNQIKQENKDKYSFDALGNPTDCKVNDLNQITENSKGNFFSYDLNGSLIEKKEKDRTVQYKYDALSRLKEIIYPNQKISYSYDPLSRLKSKTTHQFKNSSWKEIKTNFFLYDQDLEIGLIDEDSNIKQLKVLGLGIKKDIGAAIAIELGNITYTPLHDLSGNIIALISPRGLIVEKYDTNAFGKENSLKNYINPWRFCSKRHDGNLIFFGIRFYDPLMQRWITPDPSGFADGSNLYAYARNNPTNRLDLFGLESSFFSDFFRQNKTEIFIPATTWEMPGIQTFVVRGFINGIKADFVISCGHFHQLQFSPEELKAGKANLIDHLKDLMPSTGNQFALVSVGNGICTSIKELEGMTHEVAKKHQGTLSINLYNKSNIENVLLKLLLGSTSCNIVGSMLDVRRTFNEQLGIRTKPVKKMEQFFAIISDKMLKINQDALWLHISHSENGVITKRAIENLDSNKREVLKKILHIFALGPAMPVSEEHVASAENVYSSKDFITYPFIFFLKDKDMAGCNIEVVPCISSAKDRNFFVADHKFLSPTYRGQWVGKIHDIKSKVGFYRGENHVQTR